MHFWTRLGHIAIDMPLKSFQTSKTNLIMERWWISAYSNIILYGLPRSTLAFRCWRAQYQVLENLSGWALWLPCSAKVHREFVLFNSHQAYPELVAGFKLQAWRSAGLLAATGSPKWFLVESIGSMDFALPIPLWLSWNSSYLTAAGCKVCLWPRAKEALEDGEADLPLPLGSECEGWGGGGQSAEEKIASTQGKSEVWPRGHACSSCPRIAGFRYGNQQNGLREGGILGTGCDSSPKRVGA